jgi:hypothetical protein
MALSFRSHFSFPHLVSCRYLRYHQIISGFNNSAGDGPFEVPDQFYSEHFKGGHGLSINCRR